MRTVPSMLAQEAACISLVAGLLILVPAHTFASAAGSIDHLPSQIAVPADSSVSRALASAEDLAPAPAPAPSPGAADDDDYYDYAQGPYADYPLIPDFELTPPPPGTYQLNSMLLCHLSGRCSRWK